MNDDTAALAYRPIGMLASLAAGSVAGAIFKQVWRRLSDEDDAPDALHADHSLRSVLVAAVIQGVIFAVVKALIERGGAKGFERLTGSWPGK